ncbi:MAG: MTAP family purine nucleoside phosphorylase [Candidatus Eremiobacteraeota bacterium]|nr:MTAP family purine nucleoside phosphorylase [Candidatus Eremiobacteraeota bacterium]
MKSPLALIGGTVFLEHILFSGVSPVMHESSQGKTELIVTENAVFNPRHGTRMNIPPHRINHQATMVALKERGVTSILGVCSVGSLKKTLPPGSIVIPDDYINLWDTQTFFNDSLTHITPHLCEKMRRHIMDAAQDAGIPFIPWGVYVQAKGPRLETRAEVRYLSQFADVVGMTMAGEATAAQELGLSYGCICSVDNYAHGLADEPLSNDEIRKRAGQSAEIMKDIFFRLVKRLSQEGPGS